MDLTCPLTLPVAQIKIRKSNTKISVWFFFGLCFPKRPLIKYIPICRKYSICTVFPAFLLFSKSNYYRRKNPSFLKIIKTSIFLFSLCVKIECVIEVAACPENAKINLRNVDLTVKYDFLIPIQLPKPNKSVIQPRTTKLKNSLFCKERIFKFNKNFKVSLNLINWSEIKYYTGQNRQITFLLNTIKIKLYSCIWFFWDI